MEKKSLPVRGEWIEINDVLRRLWRGDWSLPVRGEWIEISIGEFSGLAKNVSPREGRVD